MENFINSRFVFQQLGEGGDLDKQRPDKLQQLSETFKGFKTRLGDFKKEVGTSFEKVLPEDLKYFRDSDQPDAKERWLVYSVLKDFFGFKDVDKESSLEDFRKRWPEEHVGEDVGLYFDAEKGIWVQSGWRKDRGMGKYLADASKLSASLNVNEELMGFMSQRIAMFDAIERQPDKRELAKSHTKEGYVNYFLLKGFGFYVDPKWDDAQLKARVDVYYGALNPSGIKKQYMPERNSKIEEKRALIVPQAEKEYEEFRKGE